MRLSTNNSQIGNSSVRSYMAKLSRAGFTLALATALFGASAASAYAQDSAISKIAPEQGFTLAPNVETGVVLKTTPDTYCGLHAEGIGGPTHTLPLFSNAEGYIRIHTSFNQESEEGTRVQLDCTDTENGSVTRYPIRLRVSSTATADMPAPQADLPLPKGSQLVPALTDSEAQQLTDEQIIGRGYPPRPDAVLNPGNYASWLKVVSQPTTLLPARKTRSGKPQETHIAARPLEKNPFWSGYEGISTTKHAYEMVQGSWYAPNISYGEPLILSCDATWVGMDGDGIANPEAVHDLEQAGTQTCYLNLEGKGYIYTTDSFTEVVPNELEQPTSVSVNPGDEVYTSVWIGNSDGVVNVHGTYAWFYFYDITQAQTTRVSTPLGGTVFTGLEVEWVVERPTVEGVVTDLAQYFAEEMTQAQFERSDGHWADYYQSDYAQVYMYNIADLLSVAEDGGPQEINFFWMGFH